MGYRDLEKHKENIAKPPQRNLYKFLPKLREQSHS